MNAAVVQELPKQGARGVSMAEPLSDEQLAHIREQVDKAYDQYRNESTSAAEVALAMDTQPLLDAYAHLRGEDAAFRPIIETVVDATVITHQGVESTFFCLACGHASKTPG
jgi:hypothetical protein